MAGLLSFKKISRVYLNSMESVTVESGYGIIIVSSSAIGRTSVSVKEAHSVVSLSEVPNIYIESLTEYSFKVTNRASIPAYMDITIIGCLI